MSELFAPGRVTNRVVESATGHAAGRGSDARAKRVERFHCQFEAIPFVSNHIFGRHATRVESDFADRMRRYHRGAFDDAKSLHLRADDESRKHGPAIFACSCPSEHGVEIRDTGVGNETLAAIYYIRFVDKTCSGL